MLGGIPLLCYSVKIFDRMAEVNEIIIVTKAEEIETAARILSSAQIKKPLKFAVGGQTRQQSVSNALEQLDTRCTHVAVHDGARPFVSAQTVKDCIKKAVAFKAATAAVRTIDTCADVRDGVIRTVLDRTATYNIQTPQVFERDLIVAAHKKAKTDNYTATDDSALAARLGCDVHIAEGSYDNIKITTPEDMILARGIINKRKQVEN